MNVEKLNKLADFLEWLDRTAPAAFDFSVITDDRNSIDGEHLNDKLKNMVACNFTKHNCGAVACAIGWLPAVFPKEIKWVGGTVVGVDDVKYERLNFALAQHFLDIDQEQSYFLFDPSRYPSSDDYDNNETESATQVAARIRNFVENDGWMPRYKIDQRSQLMFSKDDIERIKASPE